ncbi:MAG: hypothetical protein JXA90_14630, partial [Planctomycetes bacterium]|nr:hypothetical protein [Planctomycetota bacterium]
TGGSYTRAPSAADLAVIYTDYAAQIRGMESYPPASAAMARGEARSREILVDTFTREETFVLHWPEGRGAFGLSLRQPDGTVITPETPGIEYAEKPHHIFYRIRRPKPGVWQMQVRAKPTGDGRQGDVRYTTQAVADAPNLYCGIGSGAARYAPGETAVLRAVVVAGGVPVAKAEVSGQLQRPDGTASEIRLFDSGDMPAHGDEKADDGMYGARVAGLDREGVYRVTVTIANERGETAIPDAPPALLRERWRPRPIAPFTRTATTSFAVGRRRVDAPRSER